MKRQPKVPSVGADEDAATIFRAAKKTEKRSKYETRVRRMKRQPKVPSVGADEDAATIFRAAKKNIQPANQISFSKNNLKKKCHSATLLPAISTNFDSALMA